MDTSRLLLHFGTELNEYNGDRDNNNLLKLSNNNLLQLNSNTNNTPQILTKQNDISLTTISSTLPTYISHHLNYCLDNCSDRDLIKFIKYKSENNISEFRLWMKIIAPTYIPQIEQENPIINEWYYHLLNINRDTNNNSNIINSTNTSDTKEEEEHYSASDEEEHYSISTDIITLNKSPPKINNKKLKNLLFHCQNAHHVFVNYIL